MPPVHESAELPIDRLVALRRNPQFLTPHTMDALRNAIRKDGFLAPVLVRPMGDDYEVVSGNHRVMAAREEGYEFLPCVIASPELTPGDLARIAVNLNTIHGDPTPELLAPFLAELDEDVLREIHMNADLLEGVKALDEQLAATFAALDIPDAWDHDTPTQTKTQACRCSVCGHRHMRDPDAEVPDAE